MGRDVTTGSTTRGKGGKGAYKDEDDENDIADWRHGYPRRQPERDVLPGHGEGREGGGGEEVMLVILI